MLKNVYCFKSIVCNYEVSLFRADRIISKYRECLWRQQRYKESREVFSAVIKEFK